jgi:hypothetical protein
MTNYAHPCVIIYNDTTGGALTGGQLSLRRIITCVLVFYCPLTQGWRMGGVVTTKPTLDSRVISVVCVVLIVMIVRIESNASYGCPMNGRWLTICCCASFVRST